MYSFNEQLAAVTRYRAGIELGSARLLTYRLPIWASLSLFPTIYFLTSYKHNQNPTKSKLYK